MHKYKSYFHQSYKTFYYKIYIYINSVYQIYSLFNGFYCFALLKQSSRYYIEGNLICFIITVITYHTIHYITFYINKI